VVDPGVGEASGEIAQPRPTRLPCEGRHPQGSDQDAAGGEPSLEQVGQGDRLHLIRTGVGELIRDGRRYTVGDGSVGPNTRRLRQALTAIQSGAAEDRFGWLS